ncbi:hypothetical protein AAVH_06658 [Aphelenchoides avenae]|nr:hypothetical protein AAVH_06658 [Aphelenchus avenae]
MTTAASKLIGLEELQVEPCDGTGKDAMSKRFLKWHHYLPLEEVILDPTQPIDLVALGPVPCSECPNDPITKRMLAKWKPSASPASKTVDENNNECKPGNETKVTESKPSDGSSDCKVKVVSYDSLMFRGSYPMCKAEHRTGLGAAYAKLITAPARPAGAMQRGPGGPPRGPGGPPRGPGGPPRGQYRR